jgi:hypothetical protein
MITVGLVPSQQLVSLLTDDEGNWRDVPEGESVVPLVKIPKPEEGAWEPNLVWFEDRVERQWVAGTLAPVATFTAAEWVEQHLTSTQLHALSDLRLSLVLAGKPLGPLMQSLRDWTSQLIVASAVDPSPRPSWPAAPCSYEAASAEAIAALSSNP